MELQSVINLISQLSANDFETAEIYAPNALEPLPDNQVMLRGGMEFYEQDFDNDGMVENAFCSGYGYKKNKYIKRWCNRNDYKLGKICG
jgi:hypothetical protein